MTGPSFMDLPDPPEPIRRRAAPGIRTVRVTLPDGKQATRRTNRPYKYALAVHVTDDPILGDHWKVQTWLTREAAITSAIRTANDAGHSETQALDVIDDQDPNDPNARRLHP